MGATREKDSSVEKLRRHAAEMILEASSLTDELTDEDARPLVAWCLSQAEAAADAVAPSVDLTALPAGEAHEMIAERVAPVRRFMRAINALAGRRCELTPAQVVEELEILRTVAGGLPVPAGADATDTALAELAAWQTGWDNGAFVGAVLSLLQAKPAGEIQDG